MVFSVARALGFLMAVMLFASILYLILTAAGKVEYSSYPYFLLGAFAALVTYVSAKVRT